jgi:hypothetical protein
MGHLARSRVAAVVRPPISSTVTAPRPGSLLVHLPLGLTQPVQRGARLRFQLDDVVGPRDQLCAVAPAAHDNPLTPTMSRARAPLPLCDRQEGAPAIMV